MNKIATPRLKMITSMAIFGTLSIFVRNISVSSGELALYRAVLAAILIALYLIITKQKIPFQNIKKEIPLLLASGVAMGFNWILLFEAYKYTTVSIATLSYYFAPVIVTIVCPILFKEKLTPIKIIGLITTLTGCVLCSYEVGGFKMTIPTFLIGVGSGVCYGLYSIFSRFALNKGYKTETILLYSFIFAIIASAFFIPYDSFIGNLQHLDKTWLLFLGLGLLSTAAPYAFYTLGLNNMENGKASIIACFEIVASILVGLIAYHEIPTTLKIVGIIIVFISVVALNITPRKKETL